MRFARLCLSYVCNHLIAIFHWHLLSPLSMQWRAHNQCERDGCQCFSIEMSRDFRQTKAFIFSYSDIFTWILEPLTGKQIEMFSRDSSNMKCVWIRLKFVYWLWMIEIAQRNDVTALLICVIPSICRVQFSKINRTFLLNWFTKNTQAK